MNPTLDTQFSGKDKHVTDVKGERNRSTSTGCKTSAPRQDDHLLGVSHSTADINRANCPCADFDRIKYRKSIATECDETIKGCIDNPEHADVGVQVTATDIQPAVHVQVSPSLLLRTPELPARCPDCIRNKAARKCLDCDCDQTQPVIAGHSLDAGTQTEMWLVTSQEFAQIGPSLTAVGPFCRLDYHLMTAKPVKDDLYFDCCKREPGKIIVCSRDRDACSDFQQQVSALDINITEVILTENEAALRDFRGHVIYASSHPNTSGMFYKNLSLTECESPPPKNGRPIKRGHNFVMQVNQYDICPTKMIQTDVCLLPQMCITSRTFQSSDSSCEYEIPRESLLLKTRATFDDFTQQVAAIDIGNSEETQTCVTLPMAKSFSLSPPDGNSAPKKKVEQRLPTHRTRDVGIDNCDCKVVQPDVDSTNEVGVQVSCTDISISREVQTSDQIPKLTKYYIRGEQWA